MKSRYLKSLLCFLMIIGLLSGCAYEETVEIEETLPEEEQIEEEVQTIEVNINESIHINQIGYRPWDKKVAVVNRHSGSFQLVRAEDDNVVFEGVTTTEGLNDTSTGDIVFYADFSQFAESGVYFISLPGFGRSHYFSINENVYEPLGDALLKFMYFQRCGVELLSEHAGVWARNVCHLEDGYVLDKEDAFRDATGGWHDAGDYGKYTVPTAVTLAAMLLAYELFPDSFENDINIPESGNGIPDVLDESRFALDWLLKMQDSETGGVNHKLSTKNFPAFIMPHLDLARRYITPVSPTATGVFAAIMARASRMFVDIDAEFSQKALAAAELAWQWLIQNPAAPNYRNPPGVRTGEYGDWNHADERFWAAVELYITTGEAKYHEFLLSIEETGNFENFEFGWQSVAGFGSVSYLFMDNQNQDSQFSERLKDELKTDAQHFVRMSGFNGYGISLTSDDYFWGSNMLVMNRAIHLIIAHMIEPNTEFVQKAQNHLHYILGKNSLSQSFVTGFGGNPVMNPHHRPSGADFVEDPVPGMVAGGPNSRLQDPTAQQMLSSSIPPARAYVDAEGSWSTNEVTTYWNSPALFATAFFNSDLSK